MESEFVFIEKEDVGNLKFPKEDVLKSDKEIKLLKFEMNRAIALGNLEHQKVKIYFADSKMKRMVNTTIWALTDNEIVLKQNVVIPIRRIYKLEL